MVRNNVPKIHESEKQRVVRVFISSTFRDMHGERDELVKFTFPELRKKCRERAVEFVDVDLRWGIPDEQKAEGKVLPVCLAEIDRCHPYFIGLLGERYGWVPEEIDKELAEVQPWLKEHKEKSVTELEIIHGVLKDPDMKGLAFFYFRDPDKSREIELEISKEPDYQPDPEAAHSKLKSLKENIRKRHYPVRENYPDARTLGQLILDDLWKVIDERFPIEKVPTALERERMEHEAFALARTKVYISREEYFKSLDEHVAGDGLPLVLLGDSGSGKSALIANWVKEYRKNHPDDFMLLHFIGSTPDSADYVRILRRIMEEIKERCEPKSEKGSEKIPTLARGGEGGFSEEIPTDPKKVVEAFPLWLAKASARGKFILILDALNQLEDRDNAPDLGWLPEYFPPNIRVILSTLPGRSHEALKKRNLPAYPIQPIGEKERKKFIKDYLDQYRKKLNDSQSKRVASAGQTANPLFLRTLLEELRVFGIHEELDNKITHYLKAEKVDDLFELVLERLEQDYDRDRPGLVRDAMSLLWASRRGLSEKELLELTGVPPAFWSPLYLAIEGSLASRSGFLNFFHDFLRKAVEDKYLYDTELKRASHLRLADYFEKKELDDRKVDELPWQIQQAEDWERLKDCITDMEMFLKLRTDIKKYELMSYWLSIDNRFDMVEAYNAMINRYERTSPSEDELSFRLNEVAFFLWLSAEYEGAEPLCRRTLAIYEKVLGAEHPDTATSLNNLAGLLDSKGDYEGAEPLYRRALAIREKVLGKEHPDTATSLNSLAGLLETKGDYEGAGPLYRRTLAIREKALGKEHPATAGSLNNLAGLLDSKGDYEGAEPLFKRSLEIHEKVLGAEHPDTAGSLNNLALLYDAQGRYAEAEPLCRRALAIREKVLGKDHPDVAQSLNNLAELYYAQGRYAEAEPLFKRSLEIHEKVLGAEHPATATSLNNLAALLYSKGDYEGADHLHRRALTIARRTLGSQHPKTLLFKRNLQKMYLVIIIVIGFGFLCIVIGAGLGIWSPWLWLLGVPLILFGIYFVCSYIRYLKQLLFSREKFYRFKLAIREKIMGKEHISMASTVNSLAVLLHNKGDYDQAEPLYRRALAIREKVLGIEHPETIQQIFTLAQLFRDKGDHTESAKLYQQVVAIGENTKNSVEHVQQNILFMMAASHNNIAFHADVPAKHWKEAEFNYQKSIELFKKFNNPVETANVELNLQTLFRLSGQKIDKQKLKKLTQILDDVGDKRAEKGHKLLNELS